MSNQITVELLDSMGTDLTVANVARVSFNKWKDVIDAQDERLINFLAEHEHCYDEHTEIFTENGWKLFKNLSPVERVAQVYDLGSNPTMSFVKPLKIIAKKYKGDLVRGYGCDVDYAVTPDHTMIFQGRDSKGWKKEYSKGTAISAFGKAKKMLTSAKLEHLKEVDLKTEGALLGFLLGDGYTNNQNKSSTFVRLKKERKVKYLKHLLGELGIAFTESVQKDGVTSIRIHKYFELYDKEGVKNHDLDQVITKGVSFCKGLLEGLNNSDGSVKRKTVVFSSTSENLIELYKLAATVCGYSPIESVKPACKIVTLKTKNIVTIGKESGKTTEVLDHYEGFVYCVSVPSGVILTRRNGKQLVCGNCTPFRHIQIQVRCSAPIWLARQLGKHQVGMSWNEVSRRYVDAPMELFNQEFRARPDGGIKQGSGGVVEASNVPCVTVEDLHGGITGVDIQDLMKGLTDWYEEAIKAGLAPETVRGFMPQNMMTSWVWTGSLLSFFHIYRLRSDSHAQLEAQWFAEKLKETIEPKFPVAWKALQDTK